MGSLEIKPRVSRSNPGTSKEDACFGDKHQGKTYSSDAINSDIKA